MAGLNDVPRTMNDVSSRRPETVTLCALVAVLTTLRTRMRPFEPTDVESAFEVFGDAEVMKYAAGEVDATLEATRDRLARYAAHQVRYGFAKWAVLDAESEAYLGDAGIMTLRETGELELGYRFARNSWGRGLATEVARAWLEYGLVTLGLPRIIGFAHPDNVASIRVMQKVGMTFDRRDHLAGLDVVVYETS
jgi:[ribosomal protein S5]-alanine N-acetyltransferase